MDHGTGGSKRVRHFTYQGRGYDCGWTDKTTESGQARKIRRIAGIGGEGDSMDEGSKEGYNHGLIPTPWESVCLHDDGPLRAVSGHGGVLWWGLSHLCHSLALVMWVHELTPPLYLALHISFPFLSPVLSRVNTLLVPTNPRGYEPSACDRIVSHRCAQLSLVLRTQRRDKQRATPSASPPENPREPQRTPRCRNTECALLQRPETRDFIQDQRLSSDNEI